MESTTLKADNLKPVILKAGVPLAVSLAGVIYAWITTKKSLSKASSLSENKADSDTPETKISHHATLHEESYQGLSSVEDEEPATPINSSVHSGKLVIHDSSCLELDISGLRSRIEDLQMRELALNFRFDRYCDMKEQESLVMEIKNMLSLESARVEFLDKEISSLEAENMRLENFVGQYLRVIEQLEYWKSKNRVLHRKVQKLLRKSKAQSRLIKEQAMKIKAEEAEILRNHDALQTRICVISKLEDEIKELQGVLDRLQDEKNELLKKLDTAEKAYASKVHKEHQNVEVGDVSKEDYNKLLNELEQIKKERAAVVEELIRLRWTNACLKHELMKHNEQQQKQQHDQDRDHIGLEFEGNGGVIMHYESDHELHDSSSEHHNNIVPCFGSPHGDHATSKRKRLLKRLKRWVEGSEIRVKPEGGNHVRKGLGMHFVPHVAKETHVPARRSCSSAEVQHEMDRLV